MPLPAIRFRTVCEHFPNSGSVQSPPSASKQKESDVPREKKEYHSYLLRCWITAADGDRAGLEHFTVESVSDEPCHWGFATFEELVSFLHTELRRSGGTLESVPPIIVTPPVITPVQDDGLAV